MRSVVEEEEVTIGQTGDVVLSAKPVERIIFATEFAEGFIDGGAALGITSYMDAGVIFGDGMASDFVLFAWGARALR